MPDVTLEMPIRASADRVWRAIVDIERYPAAMESVRSATILEWESESSRRCRWSVTLKGSILEWEEREQLDHERMTLEFHQLRGDMELFEGQWTVTAPEPELSHVELTVSFEIGIPLLADMLNPVAQKSLRENCRDMLLGVEREALEARANVGS